eukprot:1141725-Pelagomonas_calceolata.AAC.2
MIQVQPKKERQMENGCNFGLRCEPPCFLDATTKTSNLATVQVSLPVTLTQASWCTPEGVLRIEPATSVLVMTISAPAPTLGAVQGVLPMEDGAKPAFSIHASTMDDVQGVLPREDGSKAGSSSGSSGVQTWRDASDGSDLCELTWRAAKRVSANLTPALLV